MDTVDSGMEEDSDMGEDLDVAEAGVPAAGQGVAVDRLVVGRVVEKIFD